MKLHATIPCLALAGTICFASASRGDSEDSATARQLFRTTVHPLLEAKCFGCHGEERDREADYDMRTREGLLRGGESGLASLVPGDPDQSILFQAILRQGDLKMPPKERNRLSEDEVDVLRQWILAGAIWAETSDSQEKTWSYNEEDIWAFKPRTRPEVPHISNPKSEIRNPIDAFIVEKLHGKDVKPAPPADRRTLLRRATFDLTGLPPTPEEIDAFTGDAAPDAFDKVIERLLASPHYGEKWGRHWLDVVRYADTDGFSNDYERPNAWRYRDYVIRSFNGDKPYNQFVLEQIAGDELDSDDPEALIAVGMLRMGPWEHTAMSVEAVTRQLFLDDVTHSVATAFMGLTMACAKCHDHKFDPIPTEDYYRMVSLFAPVQFETRALDFLSDENTAGFDQKSARVNRAIKEGRKALADIRAKREAAVAVFLKEKGAASVADLPAAERPKKDFGLDAADLWNQKILRKRIEYDERELQRYQPRSYSVASGGLKKKVETPKIHILTGGSIEAPAEPVTPGLLRAVVGRGDMQPAFDLARQTAIPETDHGRRLALARWITDPDHPLTARVMVNRIWQGHFGKGLVGTANNFGRMGERPTHPELLDWLANYFVEHNWSVKEMHRLILRSAAYQQSATHPESAKVHEADPEQQLYAHFQPRRLTAEEIRDSILQVSGELSRTMGGPGVFPEINVEAALQPRHIMGSVAPAYVPSLTREERNRRTLYAFQIRGLINPLLDVFNFPNTENSCEARDQTTVTPQAFALFNSQASHDHALAMAHRLASGSRSRDEQIRRAFRLAYGRAPDAREMALCAKHVERMEEHHRKTTPVDFVYPDKVVRRMVEELTGEPFEFEESWDLAAYEPNLRPSEVPPETRALAELCLVILNSNEFVYVY